MAHDASCKARLFLLNIPKKCFFLSEDNNDRLYRIDIYKRKHLIQSLLELPTMSSTYPVRDLDVSDIQWEVFCLLMAFSRPWLYKQLRLKLPATELRLSLSL